MRFTTRIPRAARPRRNGRSRARRTPGSEWSKQFYHYVVETWLDGDGPDPPSPQRLKGRNSDWRHVHCRDILSMPDTWEYPWFAAWDLAFHVIALGATDPHFAKKQMLLLLREWLGAVRN